jgi:hypothetical protein
LTLGRGIALAAATLAVCAYTPPPLFRRDLNPQPSDACRSCHIDITGQWFSSAHARADRSRNLLFGRMYFYSLKETRGATFTKCGPCHETVSFVLNDFEVPHARDVSGEGVTCTFCHSIAGAGPATAVPPVSLDLAKFYGTVRTPVFTNAHKSGYLAYIKSSDFCGSCHKYANQYGIPITDTIGEWKATKYAKQGVTCQSCHMPGEPGRNSAQGPPRPRVADHSFARGQDNPKLAKAVDLQLHAERLAGDSLRVFALVTNVGAGHSLPTGNDQHMLLVRLRVLTADGKIVWENDPFSEWNVSVFSLVLADEIGRWPAETWNARKVIADRRIKAGRSARIFYDVPLGGAAGPYRIEAQVLFRSGRPATLAAYGLDESLWGAERVMTESTLRVP